MEVDLSWRWGVEDMGICIQGVVATVTKHSEISVLNKSFFLAHIKAAEQ